MCKLVLAYASDGGSGASQAIMDEVGKGGGSVIKDLSKVGVFGVGMFGPEGDAVKAAAAGNGALQGCHRLRWRRPPGRDRGASSRRS